MNHWEIRAEFVQDSCRSPTHFRSHVPTRHRPTSASHPLLDLQSSSPYVPRPHSPIHPTSQVGINPEKPLDDAMKSLSDPRTPIPTSPGPESRPPRPKNSSPPGPRTLRDAAGPAPTNLQPDLPRHERTTRPEDSSSLKISNPQIFSPDLPPS